MTALNSKTKYKKLPVVVHVVKNTSNLIISRCGYANDWKAFGLVMVSLTNLSSLMRQRPYVTKVAKQHEMFSSASC